MWPRPNGSGPRPSSQCVAKDAGLGLCLGARVRPWSTPRFASTTTSEEHGLGAQTASPRLARQAARVLVGPYTDPYKRE
eukprot:scaffold41817_cov68-Phaeocystis_antarctica.AAC.5